MENIEISGPRQRLVPPNAPVNPVDANAFRPIDNNARRTIVGHDAISPCAGRAMARLKAPHPPNMRATWQSSRPRHRRSSRSSGETTWQEITGLIRPHGKDKSNMKGCS